MIDFCNKTRDSIYVRVRPILAVSALDYLYAVALVKYGVIFVKIVLKSL